MTMPPPYFFYTQPHFRASSLDLAKLKEHTKWTLNTPGIGLALAFDYYRFEAFATEDDRDAGCGQTAHEDVRYVPATLEDLRQNGVTLDDIACGHTIDHPRFDEIMTPLFDAALRRLVRDVLARPRKDAGMLASTDILIARTRYSISAETKDEWINFPIEALTAFEDGDRAIMDRTMDWLHNRLVLTASPSLFDAEAN